MRIRDEHGFTLVDMLFVVFMIGVLCVIAMPKMIAAQTSAGAASAIGGLRMINSAEIQFALSCGNGFYATDLPSLAQVPPGGREGFVPPGFGEAVTVIHSAYVFQVDAVPYDNSPPTCNGIGAGQSGQAFRAVADPALPSGTRFFATNASGTIYEDVATFSTTMPEIGSPPNGHPLH